MHTLHTLPQLQNWSSVLSPNEQQQAIQSLETGKVLYFPDLAFRLEASENSLLTPASLAPKTKNVSYTQSQDQLRGTALTGTQQQSLHAVMRRFAESAQALVQATLPEYTSNLIIGRTSYRPAEVQKRDISPRKDDTRLHVDAFPSVPTQGKRILRVFSNLNPQGQARQWRVGTELFAQTVQRFLSQLKQPLWGSATLLKSLGITRQYRTRYDSYMLQLHDLMKSDETYQQQAPQEAVAFPPATSWIVFTDQTPHAAMQGQYILEQTFYLPPHGNARPRTSTCTHARKIIQTSTDLKFFAFALH